MQPHERKNGITKLKLLAVVWSVKHLRLYLYGHKCHIFTDCEALKSILNTPLLSGKLAHWVLLQELDLTIHYVPRKKSPRAGALSCLVMPLPAPDSSTYLPVVALTAVDSDYAKGGDSTSSELQDCQHGDSQLHRMIDQLEVADWGPSRAATLVTFVLC